MKVSELVAKRLSESGIDIVFGVTGGAIVHMFEAANSSGIKCVFTHHEQAAAYAAVAYARLKGIGAAFFTTGPGCSNAITGVAAAWTDSIPVVFIGGQVRSGHIKPSSVRQQGAQELDVVALMNPIVKYAKTITSPFSIREEIEKALLIAKSGRPGPVYLEIPLEFQWAEIAEDTTAVFNVSHKKETVEEGDFCLLVQKLSAAKKPILLAGQGIKLAGAKDALECFLNKTQMPTLSTWNALDMFDKDSGIHLGCPGMFGTREANLALTQCDFLLCIGTHLPIPVTTGNIEGFAPHAEIAVVNIDIEELSHLRIDASLLCQMDAGDFLTQIEALIFSPLEIDPWRARCREIKRRFARKKENANEEGQIDMYQALLHIQEASGQNDVYVVDGGGTIVQAAFQTLEMKMQQKIIIDAGLCSMGSGLPQAIGAAFASKAGNIICLCGDGSFQFNVQELETIRYHNLPVKICIFNNGGYLSIRQTQEAFLGSNFLGSAESGGISVPSISRVAFAYGIPAAQLHIADDLEKKLVSFMELEGPALCEIIVSPKQAISPKIGFDRTEDGRYVARPMGDMWPYIAKEELAELLS